MNFQGTDPMNGDVPSMTLNCFKGLQLSCITPGRCTRSEGGRFTRLGALHFRAQSSPLRAAEGGGH